MEYDSRNNCSNMTSDSCDFVHYIMLYIWYTGWLKLKYFTGQNAISRQPCEIFIPKFLGLYERDPASEFLKKYFSFLQSYGCINILCHIFNSAWNNQQQLVIFIVKKHWLLLQIPKSHKQFILAYVRSVHRQLSRKPEVFSGSSIRLCWSSLVAAGPISTAELSWAHRCSPAWVEITCSVQA